MQTAAARQNFRMSSGRIFPACARRKSRRNARFSSISATFTLTYTETSCIKDSVGIDIGCGSGILSIAALLLGAGHATAVDIDKLAVKTARENALRNGIDEERYTVYNGSLADKVSGKFDIVAANIVADAIIALSSDVGRLMNEDGVYIVSGIIDSRETEVAAALDKYGFEIINRYSENGWICLESIVKKI